MNVQETSALLALVGTFDARAIPTDDLSLQAKATAWAAAFDVTLPIRFARTAVTRHYASSDDPITPAMLNELWRRANSTQVEEDKFDAHCGRAGCVCTHTAGCFRGWVDTTEKTTPCPQCRDQLDATLRTIPSPGRRQDQHYARLVSRGRA